MDVTAWLQVLGLERHDAAFRDNLIDMGCRSELNENDLEGSVWLGERKQHPEAAKKSPKG